MLIKELFVEFLFLIRKAASQQVEKRSKEFLFMNKKLLHRLLALSVCQSLLLPTNFAELEALCSEIKEAGLERGYTEMQLTGIPGNEYMLENLYS